MLDDWGILDVVLSNSLGLPEAAEAIHRLAAKWNVPHDRISYDKLGIGRNFPDRLARMASPRRFPTRAKATADANTFVNLRSEAAWKPQWLDLTHTVYEPPAHGGACPAHGRRELSTSSGGVLRPAGHELRPLTYTLVGRKTRLMPKDEWAAILGHSPDIADALIQSMILAGA